MNIRTNGKNGILAAAVLLGVIALVAVTVLSAAPQVAATDGSWSGSGIQIDPYLIEDAADLAELATEVNGGNAYANAYFQLTCDIDLSAAPYDAGWVPIGNSSNIFSGNFDGNGYTVTGMYINTTASYIGLFGYIGSGGEVKNIGISDANIRGSYYTGGLAGYNLGKISNSFTAGMVSGGNYAGGLVGYNDRNGMVANCYSNCTVSSSSINAGGLAGYNDGIVTNCHSASGVTASGSPPLHIGGIVGTNGSFGKVEGCYNTGTITGSSSIGGIAGTNSGLVINCYNAGTISGTGTSYAGGVAGSNNSLITNCYSIGAVTGSGSVGGVIGTGASSPNVVAKACFFLRDAGINTTLNGTGNISDTNTLPETSAWMKDGSGFTDAGWDFTNTWTFVSGENDGYPVLINYAVSDEIKEIYSVDELMLININSVTLGGNYLLMNDLTFTAEDNQAFVPIGPDSANKFTGTFDGGGHTISGLAVEVSASSGNSYAGLFGYASGAAISNLNLTDDTITATLTAGSWSAFAGGIVGYADSSTISNCSNAGPVTAGTESDPFATPTAYAGGIVGCINTPTKIQDCCNTGSVTAISPSDQALAGGIVGQGSGSAENCYNTGSVQAKSLNSLVMAGGIAGWAYIFSIEGSYNTGTVLADSEPNDAYAGGIAGNAYYSAIENCYNTASAAAEAHNTACAAGILGLANGSVTVVSCYSIGGPITASASPTAVDDGGVSHLRAYAAGIIGLSSSSTITCCYFLENTVFGNATVGSADSLSSTLEDGDAAANQVSGAKTAYQMTPTLSNAQNGNSIYYDGSEVWDFTNTWTIVEETNGGYPVLIAFIETGPEGPTSYDVTLTPGTGYTLTPADDSSSPVESGGSFSFTMIIDPEYAVNHVVKVLVNGDVLTPVSGIYTITNITEDQTVTVAFDPIIGSSSVMNGGSVTINGTIDPSAGATYVKVYITFSDGSVINSTFTIGPLGDFSTGYSGSMHVVSYLITAYDGKPGTSGTDMVAWTETNNI